MSEPLDNFERKLAGELKGLYGGPAGGRGDDARILAAARSAGEAAVRGRGVWRWRVGIGIAAAVALAAGVLWSEIYRGTPTANVRQEAAREARASERTGDIRDAYFVARELKGQRTVGLGWDSNGDGVVDQKDVQALALAAVRLPMEKGEVR